MGFWSATVSTIDVKATTCGFTVKITQMVSRITCIAQTWTHGQALALTLGK